MSDSDDERTPPSSPRRITRRKQYDVKDLVDLAIADLRVTLHPFEPSPELRERVEYWIGRGWDLGRAAVERGQSNG